MLGHTAVQQAAAVSKTCGTRPGRGRAVGVLALTGEAFVLYSYVKKSYFNPKVIAINNGNDPFGVNC